MSNRSTVDGGFNSYHHDMVPYIELNKKRPRYLDQLISLYKSIYIAGPYTSDPDKNAQNAIDAWQMLKDYGFNPFNPMLNHFMGDHTRTPSEWLGYDFHWLDRCSSMYTLPGPSYGAYLEECIGTDRHLKVYRDEASIRRSVINTNLLIVLYGVSGSGKSTIENVLASLPGYEKLVSHTTRAPRPGEVEGVDYYFNSPKFDELSALEKSRLIEHTHYRDNDYYLTEGFLDKPKVGGVFITVFDKNGVKQLLNAKMSDGRKLQHELNILPIKVFGQEDICIERMIGRGNTSEQVCNRINGFHEENKEICDYRWRYSIDGSKRLETILPDVISIIDATRLKIFKDSIATNVRLRNGLEDK